MFRKINAGILLGCIGFVALILSVRGLIAVRAQGTELLTNNGMDSYVGGPGGVVPTGWTLTANVPVNSSKQDWVFNEFPGFGSSWKVDTSNYTFTMNAYQFVAGVRAGTPLVFTAYANVFTCNRQDSCIGADTPRTSQRESNARTRIGIDPTGGTNPNAPTVRWSPYIQPFDQFLPMTIEARSENDNGVTVFLNATQDVGMLLNHVYWDNVSLRAGVGSGGAGVPVPTVRRDVPFVTPQGMQPDGSIIHVVQEGDTLASIAVAYGITVSELRRLNNIPPEEFVIRPGQRLLVKTPAPNVTYIVVTATPTPDPNASPTPSFTPFIVLPTNTPIRIIPITIVPATPIPTGQSLMPTSVPRLRIPPQDPRRILTVPIRPRSTFPPPSDSGRLPTVESVALSVSATPTNSPSTSSLPSAMPLQGVDLPSTTPAGMTVLIITTPTALPTELPPTLPPTTAPTVVPSPEAIAVAASPTGLPTAASSTAVLSTQVAAIPTIAQDLAVPDQAQLCIIAFDDANTNRLRDQGEPLLVGMQISLLQDGVEVQALSTAAVAPACFTELAEGTYTLIAVPPETYGMTTPQQVQAQAQRGVTLLVSFGAAGSYQSTAVSAVLELPPPSSAARPDAQRGPLLTFVLDNFGLVVALLAALTLISGLSVALIVQRS
ncbi:MAG: LysM peptidoglycan-binding domain-containing protein [Aggregatilineales bacterium]